MSSNKDIEHIKRSYESLSSKAPDGVWKNIADDLSNSQLDKKIQQSFESSEVIKSPSFDLIAGNYASHQLDDLVKLSYEQTSASAPVGSWDKIYNGLEVEQVWENLSDKIQLGVVRHVKMLFAASVTFY